MDNDFVSSFLSQLDRTYPYRAIGKVIASRGLAYEVILKKASIGSNVEFVCDNGEKSDGEVIGIKGDLCFIMPYYELSAINNNTRVYLKESITHIKVSKELLGRVVDFSGTPIDKKESISSDESELRSVFGKQTNPLDRSGVSEPLDIGIKSINCFMTMGKGQRLAIMAGSGVGKSVLMGMVARNTKADVNVIALIGERGREVVEFIEHDLGEEGLKRSIVVVATSDTSPLMRMKAAYTATTIAEYFRDQGSDVMLMMDSITRFAMAGREIGMSIGEPPGPKGYGPSVFARLPKLMERAGAKKNSGSITGIYTVLVEGGDMDEPIADSVRSISDGHIVLSRSLAAKNHYPAIDVLQSVSRVMPKVVSKEHKIISSHLRDLLSVYRDSEDLINVGAYVRGANIKLDKALVIIEELNQLLKQEVGEKAEIEDLYDYMVELARKAEKEVNPEIFAEKYQK